MFDLKDVAKSPSVQPTGFEVEDCNISTEENPKIVKISKLLPTEEKQKYIDLFKQYTNVFAWGYQDLKVYGKDTIQHTIPIKEDQKPFKQKLSRVNLVLLPSIEKGVKSCLMQKL